MVWLDLLVPRYPYASGTQRTSFWHGACITTVRARPLAYQGQEGKKRNLEKNN